MSDTKAVRVKELGFEKLPKRILKKVREAIHIVLRPAKEKDLAIGASRFGGAPDLPPELEWPKSKAGTPLAFFFQINFAEAKPFDGEGLLPEKGWLCFFVESDMNNYDRHTPKNHSKLIFFDGDAATLHRRTPPPLPKEGVEIVKLKTSSLEFHREIEFDDNIEDDLDEYDEDGDAQDVLDTWKTVRKGKKVEVCWDTSRPSNEADHKLLGHLHYSATQDTKTTRLLLKIDSDFDNTGMSFISSGIWLFFINVKDLAAKNFSKIKPWLSLS